MTMTVWVLIGLSVTAAIAALLLKTSSPAYSMVLTISAGVLILSATISEALPLIERITSLLSRSVPDSTYTTILVKAIGIAVLTQSAADVCRDAGESALAGKAELAGNILLLLCGLPLYEQALSLLESVILGQAVTA